MKTNHIFFIIVLSISILFTETANSQTRQEAADNPEQKITSFEKSFYKIFTQSGNLCSKILNDSVAIYATNFKIEVIKTGNNKTLVTKIKAKDTLAYKLFPKYPELKKLNFIELFNKSDRKITVIMPILVYGVNDKRIKYRDKNGNPLTNLSAAINALNTSYDISNEGFFNRLIIARPLICDYKYVE